MPQSKLNHSAELAPELLMPWLSEEHSLTNQLKALTGDASLNVLGDRWIQSGWWEKYVLGIQNELVYQRDIVMCSQGTPCWFARTLVTESVFHRHQNFFARLENCSLNILLWEEHLAVRQHKVIYSMTADSLEFYWIKQALSALDVPLCLPNDGKIWGRRSCFNIHEHPQHMIDFRQENPIHDTPLEEDVAPFYLVEIMLPSFMDVLA